MLPDMFSRWSLFFLLSSEGLASTFHIRHYPVYVGGRADSAYENGAVEGGQQRHRVRKNQRHQKRWIVEDKNQGFLQDDYLEDDLYEYADYGYADYIYVPPSPALAFGPVKKNFNVQGLFNLNDASGISELTVDGLPCSSVWKYKQKIFFGCTASRAGPLWCSTKVDSENNHILGHWGWCAPEKVRPKINRMPGSSCSDGFGVCRLKCQLDEEVAEGPFMENSCSPIGVPLCCIKAIDVEEFGKLPVVSTESSETSDSSFVGGGATDGQGVTNTDVSGTFSEDGSTIIGDTSSVPGAITTNTDEQVETSVSNTSNAAATSVTPATNIVSISATSAAPGANTNNPNVTTPDTNGATSETNNTSLDGNTTKSSTNAPSSNDAGVTPVSNVTDNILSSKPSTSPSNLAAAEATPSATVSNLESGSTDNNAPNLDAVAATSSSSAANINTAVSTTGTNVVNTVAATAVPGITAATISSVIASSPDSSSVISSSIAPNPGAAGVTIGAQASNPGADATSSSGNVANLVGATSQLPSLNTPPNPIGKHVDAAEDGGYESEKMDLSAVENEGYGSETMDLSAGGGEANAEVGDNQVAVSSSDSVVQPKKREVQGVVSSSKGSILQALLSKVEDIASEYEDELIASNSEDSEDEASETDDDALQDDNISSQYIDDIVKTDDQAIADDSSQSAASDNSEKSSEN